MKKLQKNFRIIAILCLGFTVHAAPCEDCNKIHTELEKEVKLKESYVLLKAKNEDYLKKPGVAPGAAIKVQSNLMLLGIKIETKQNIIQALLLEKKKLNNCVQCPLPKQDEKS